jgi:hypothetical protein
MRWGDKFGYQVWGEVELERAGSEKGNWWGGRRKLVGRGKASVGQEAPKRIWE